jgi:proteasome accessory factor B
MPSSSITKTQRWLDLISYLVGRRYPVELSELLDRLPAYARMEDPASARRTFERDKEELTALGIPLAFEQIASETGGDRWTGYFLRTGDFFLPWLKVVEGAREPRAHPSARSAGTLEVAPEHLRDAAEALARVAALPASPLADDARRAYAKLVFGLDTSQVLEGSPVQVLPPPDGADSSAVLATLSDALIERRGVRIRYRGIHRDEATERRVDPYGLIVLGGRWYLVGHDHLRGELRQFRVGRIDGVQRGGAGEARERFEVPEDFDLTAYARRQPWELGDPAGAVEARVRFPFPWSLWAERNGHGARVEVREDGSAVHAFHVTSSEPFLRWLLAAEAELELLGPDEHVAAFAALAAAVAAMHEDDGEADARD